VSPLKGGTNNRSESDRDKGKAGTKRHVVVEGSGIPLCVISTAANVHDSMVFEELLDSIEPIKGPRGRPRKRPDKVHAYTKPTTTKSARKL
jgi:IS5 family transposase